MNCSECGNIVSNRANTCPKCGCPVDISLEVKHRKGRLKLKRMGITVILLSLLIIIIFLVVKYFNRPNTDGYYENTKWGSGVIASKKGYIVTNEHIAGNKNEN